MPRAMLGLVLAGGTLLVAQEASACGDKFLVIGRGVRQQRAQGAMQRASILLYLGARGQLRAALSESKLESNLKLAGHRLHRAEGRSQLAESLASGKYDIVLAHISEMAALEQAVGSARPVLLPIIYNPTGEELAEAEAEFSCVMRSPSTKKHYLAVIDEAMVLRKKARNP